MQPPMGNQNPWPQQGQTGPQQPFSGNTGPFEDTGYAPELRAERSENLYRKEDQFWQRMPDPQTARYGRPKEEHYFDHPQTFRPTRGEKPPKARAGGRTAVWIGGIALVLVVVAIVLYSTVPLVKNIQVEGNSAISDEEIIAMSGLSVGMNRFRVQEEAVMERIERNRYLVCELVHQPDLWTVVIRVKERKPVAAIAYNGLQLHADHRGIVLEEYLDSGQRPAGLVLVKGMDIRRSDLGRTLTLNQTSQLYVYNEIFVELDIMNALDWMVELDMSDMDSIFLTTSDGYTIRLGDSTDIHSKLRAMILTIEYLRGNGHGEGTVAVSAPVYPSYIPDDSQS